MCVKADIVGVSSLRRRVAEAIETVAHGDSLLPAWLAASLTKLNCRQNAIIGAVVRGNDVMII